MKTRYRVDDQVPVMKARRAASKAAPLALLGLFGYALWTQRERLNGVLQSLTAKADAPAAETIPDEYDWNRPSVANSTAMAGPVNGAGEPHGLDGGSMGTELGTQGEGAL